MAFPKLTDLFLIREGLESQHWSSDGRRYRVDLLYAFAEASAEPEEIPITSLRYGLEHTNLDEPRWSPEFIKRARESDLSYPILVVMDSKKRLWVADGNHRVGKAIMQGLNAISGYVVRERDLPEKAIEPREEGDEGSHRGRKSAGE